MLSKIKRKINQKISITSLKKLAKLIFLLQIKKNDQRSVKQSMLLTAIVTGLTIIFFWQSYTIKHVPLHQDGHTNASFDIAICRVVFDKISHTSGNNSIAQYVVKNPEMIHHSILSLPSHIAGSDKEYSDKYVSNAPTINNENSMMLLIVLLLKLFPNITFIGLGFV
ncbi:hypothetical protein ACFL47_10400, partial [Candidatus Latescibacterota bacterium]